MLGKNIGNELTPDSYNVTTQRQAADYVIFWTMLDKDLEKPSSVVFSNESYTGTLFTGVPWTNGVTADY